MLESVYAPSSDNPLGSGDPRLFLVDLGRSSLVFSVFCSVRCRSGDLLSPPTDLRWRARELPNLTPTTALLLVRGTSAARSSYARHPGACCFFFKGK
ncbi:hypothetical protein SLEP1_g32725 [Rubroshorea leprosula]|uniref:Uncharacterized protein n=1 Tax=Rubroshorea leprosula TaxID=152421 RepID=A0AAV5KED6_9ROSI|nr:hypothetical protein SLEP1_g32725 [Rubroshorea leprosula]